MRIILLRGLGRDQLHWKPLLNCIQQHLPNTLVETPDLPGAGIRCHHSSPTRLTDYIPWVEEQLSESTEPAIVVGLSLGGMVALKWAELCPEKFTGVVMINSSSRLSMFYSRLKVYRAVKHPAILFRWNPRAKENATYHLTCNRRPIPAGLLDEWENIQRMHPVKVSNQVRQAWAALNYRLPDKASIPPLTIIYSKNDRFVDPECSIRLAKHYDADTHVHSWAGHDLPQDDPEWLVSKLQQVIDELLQAE